MEAVIPIKSFYPPETPPKRSRLQDCHVKPPFSTFKDQLIDFDKKVSGPITSSVSANTTTHVNNQISKQECSIKPSPLPLKNLGNTCYENSIIQCLFSLDTFMENFKRSIKSILTADFSDSADFRHRITNAFYNLYNCYEQSFQMSQDDDQRQRQLQQLESRLEELKLAVGEKSSQFNSAHQQDASEFFYHVIDSIQEYYQSLKTADHDNPVTLAFELELDYLMRCPKCHHKVISESEKIRTLPLALPHVNNESSQSTGEDADINRIPTPPTSDLGLDSPKSEEKTSNELNGVYEEKENQALGDVSSVNVYRPSRFSAYDPSSKMNLDLHDEGYMGTDSQQVQTHDVEQQRYTLCDALNNYFEDDVLDLKCSQPDCDSKHRTKKCLIKKLPQVLFITLARYSYSGKKSLDEIEAPFELSVPFQENKSPCHSPSSHREFGEHDSNYRLVAVVCHLGSSLDAGHYTCYVFNQTNSSWYSCDDDTITKVQEQEVKNDARKSGYCFFYAHKSSIANLGRDSVTMEQVESNDRVGAKPDATDCVEKSSVVMTPESSPSPPPPTFTDQETSLLESTET